MVIFENGPEMHFVTSPQNYLIKTFFLQKKYFRDFQKFHSTPTKQVVSPHQVTLWRTSTIIQTRISRSRLFMMPLSICLLMK